MRILMKNLTHLLLAVALCGAAGAQADILINEVLGDLPPAPDGDKFAAGVPHSTATSHRLRTR